MALASRRPSRRFEVGVLAHAAAGAIRAGAVARLIRCQLGDRWAAMMLYQCCKPSVLVAFCSHVGVSRRHLFAAPMWGGGPSPSIPRKRSTY